MTSKYSPKTFPKPAQRQPPSALVDEEKKRRDERRAHVKETKRMKRVRESSEYYE